MKMLIVPVAAASILAAGAAVAHPTDTPYETRGACEVAYAESSKLDRERLVERGFFPTIGAAQSSFQDRFACEYDEDEDAWFIIDHWQS